MGQSLVVHGGELSYDGPGLTLERTSGAWLTAQANVIQSPKSIEDETLAAATEACRGVVHIPAYNDHERIAAATEVGERWPIVREEPWREAGAVARQGAASRATTEGIADSGNRAEAGTASPSACDAMEPRQETGAMAEQEGEP
jgi:hypothetical protein